MVTGISGGCAFPSSDIIPVEITKTACLVQCLEHRGCLGMNFRLSFDGSELGQCMIVAASSEPTADHVLPTADPQYGEWQYFTVNA